MSHVFISYAHADGEFVQKVLLPELKKARFNHWIDSEQVRAGEDWRQSIDDGIKSAFTLVVVMSQKAKESEYVTYEWAFALGVGIKVIPVIIETIKLHPRLEALQYLDFMTGNRIDQCERLIRRLNELSKEYRSQEAVQKAKELLTSPYETERKQGVDALVQLKAEEALIEIMYGTSYPDVRVEAALALGNFRNSEAIPVILEVLYSNSDQNLRLRAAKIFASLGKKVIPMLQKALKDGDDFVRSYAAITLGQAFMTDATSVEHLIAALNDSCNDVRASAIESLGSIGDSRAVPYLTKILLEDENIMLRQKAALALGQIGDDNSIINLLSILRSSVNPQMVQNAVIGALENIGGNAELHLIKGLNEDNKWVRTTSAYLLGKLVSTRAVPNLIPLLGDIRAVPHSPGWPQSNRRICDVVAEALKAIGTPETVDPLKQWQQEQSSNGIITQLDSESDEM